MCKLMQKILFTNMGVFSMRRMNNLNRPGCRSRRCAAVWNDSREQNKKDSAFIMATAKHSIKVKECPVWVELNKVSAPGAAITSVCELLHMSRSLVLQQLTHTVGSLIRVSCQWESLNISSRCFCLPVSLKCLTPLGKRGVAVSISGLCSNSAFP